MIFNWKVAVGAIAIFWLLSKKKAPPVVAADTCAGAVYGSDANLAQGGLR